jgi:tetratricopeptide (TPR) repeat protein
VTIRLDDPLLVEDLPGRLEGLDTELFCFPDEALRSTQEAVLAAVCRLDQDACSENVEFVCRALGALASAYRVHARFGLAARGLRLAFRLCEARGLASARANLLQRTCYLVGDQGEYDLAVELARRSSDEYLMLNDRAGLGKALVVRAVMHNLAGSWDAAIKAYELGLEYLPKGSWISRWSCYQGLARIYTILGRIGDARLAVDKAAQNHQTSSGQNWWRLVWLKGDIALEEGDVESAEGLFREAREGLAALGNPFDVALVSLRLAKALFMAGRIPEIRALAAELMCLLKPLEKHKVAAGAVYEFVGAALAGEVAVELLDNIYRKIEKDAPRIGASESR